MRMLQSLGQYSQLGLGGFGSPFGGLYDNHSSLDQQGGQGHRDYENDLKNDFHKPHQKPMVNDRKVFIFCMFRF